MAGWNGSGSFTRAHDWTTDRDGGVKILASRMDTEDDNFAAGIQACLTKNGENAATANLPMGGFRHTGVGNASARTHYGATGQIQDGTFNYAVASGTDTITMSLTPSITAYAEGAIYVFQPAANNATTTPTLNIDSVGATTIVKRGSVALAAGDIIDNEPAVVVYNSTDDVFTLLNPVTDAFNASSSDTLTNKTIDGDDNTLQDIGTASLKTRTGADASVVTGTAGTNGQVATWNGDGDIVGTAQSSISGALPRSYLAGLTMSNDTDTDHDILVAAGVCRDAADGVNISLSAITKQIDATWASGDDAGGLSSSLTAPANNTWYHVFAIVVSGSADVGFDTSLTAANLVADHSATAYRRIGSVLTDGSANILAFSQVGDEFLWADPPLDYNSSTLSTTAATPTLTVPTGVKVWAKYNAYMSGGSDRQVYISSLDQNDEAPSNSAAPLASIERAASGDGAASPSLTRTNTSAQVRIRATAASTTALISTLGWIDRRGRDD